MDNLPTLDEIIGDVNSQSAPIEGINPHEAVTIMGSAWIELMETVNELRRNVDGQRQMITLLVSKLTVLETLCPPPF
jgi:hypothetical protein